MKIKETYSYKTINHLIDQLSTVLDKYVIRKLDDKEILIYGNGINEFHGITVSFTGFPKPLINKLEIFLFTSSIFNLPYLNFLYPIIKALSNLSVSEYGKTYSRYYTALFKHIDKLESIIVFANDKNEEGYSIVVGRDLKDSEYVGIYAIKGEDIIIQSTIAIDDEVVELLIKDLKQGLTTRPNLDDLKELVMGKKCERYDEELVNKLLKAKWLNQFNNA